MSDDLSQILGKWRGIDPRPDFDAQVWNAIHAGEGTPTPTVFSDWRLLFPAMAASVVLAIGIGLLVAATMRTEPSPFADHFSLSRPGTITGNYALLAQGEKP